MPSSLQAWMMRRAISPRLAIRIFLNIAPPALARLDGEERLAELDRLGVLGVDLGDHPVDVRLDLVHQLHRLDDAEHLPLLDPGADLDERAGVGRRRPIEGADDRRGED